MSHARSPVLTIAPGTTVEMTTTVGFNINGGGFVLDGSPTAPITLTRAPGTASWGQVLYAANVNPASRLSFATVMYGGGTTGAIDFRGDALSLDHVTVRLRAEQAGQAGDAAALSRQTAAYRDYQRARGAALQRLAVRLDASLTLTQGAGVPDVTIAPGDYADYLNELLTVGYDTDTITFHQALGLSDAEIQALLELEIATLRNTPLFVTSFYSILEEIRDAAADRGSTLKLNYGRSGAQVQTVGRMAAEESLYLGTLTTDFVVGNPQETVRTVDLVVRPVQLPLDWSYRLSSTAVQLAPGETTMITLTIDVGHAIAQDSQARISVEGYIVSELIGGILFVQEVPAPALNAIYLPLVIRSQD